MSESLTIHATCVAFGPDAVLLLGRPGAGKSDLALRLIDAPGYGIGAAALRAELVADDQTELRRAGSQLFARAPASLAGRLEIRGLGIVPVAAVQDVAVALAVQLTPADAIERLPDPAWGRTVILGLAVALISIDPTKPSAPARLRVGLQTILHCSCVPGRLLEPKGDDEIVPLESIAS